MEKNWFYNAIMHSKDVDSTENSVVLYPTALNFTLIEDLTQVVISYEITTSVGFCLS